MQVGLRIVHRGRLLEPERYNHQRSSLKGKMVGWESFTVNVIVDYNCRDLIIVSIVRTDILVSVSAEVNISPR